MAGELKQLGYKAFCGPLGPPIGQLVLLPLRLSIASMTRHATFPTRIYYKKLMVGNPSQSWSDTETGRSLSKKWHLELTLLLESQLLGHYVPNGTQIREAESTGVRNPIKLTNFEVVYPVYAPHQINLT